MVGDQVDDQAHAAGPEGGHQLAQAGLAAQLGGDLGRVDHVVAVGRPAPGPQDRRGVQVRDAQVGQVGHDRLGGRERERPRHAPGRWIDSLPSTAQPSGRSPWPGAVGETAVGIAAAVRAGRVTPTEVLEEHLERIAALDQRLGAFRCSGPRRSGPRRAALEDLGDLGGCRWPGCRWRSRTASTRAGAPTRSGSAATSQEPATADAELVRRLREAGALLVGKTSLPELGLWPFTESEASGVTRNP